MADTNDILKEYDKQCKLYENFASKVKTLVEELVANENIIYNSITSRIKTRASLEDKITRKNNKYKTLGNITDIAGVRVITYYSDDVDRVAKIIEQNFNVDKKNSIDKRKAMEPDRFGYCSVHYIVQFNQERLNLPENQAYKDIKCEIQIRTVLQHAWAEIEHDLGYKSEFSVPTEIRRNFSRLAGLLEIGDKEFLEIRNFLTKYQKDVTKNIEKGTLNDKELDIVLLSEIINTDETYQKINDKITKYAQGNYVQNISNGEYEIRVLELKLVGIRTLGQLKNCIEKNADMAIYLAEQLFSRRERKDGYYNKTIGAFYLCYAELLSKTDDVNRVKKYLDAAKIDHDDSFPQYLLRIAKEKKETN